MQVPVVMVSVSSLFLVESTKLIGSKLLILHGAEMMKAMASEKRVPELHWACSKHSPIILQSVLSEPDCPASGRHTTFVL